MTEKLSCDCILTGFIICSEDADAPDAIWKPHTWTFRDCRESRSIFPDGLPHGRYLLIDRVRFERQSDEETIQIRPEEELRTIQDV